MIIQLTQEQIDAIAPAFQKICEMSEDGKPGMLLAQVYSDHMRVGIMSSEASTKMLEAIGADPTRVHRTGYEAEGKAVPPK